MPAGHWAKHLFSWRKGVKVRREQLVHVSAVSKHVEQSLEQAKVWTLEIGI